MSSVALRCPQCQRVNRQTWPNAQQALACSHCSWRVAADASLVLDNGLARCAVCRGDELFVRKGFPQRWGVSIVLLGFLISSITWYFYQVILTFGVLLATAMVDAVLYLVMGNVLECYRCHSQYYDLPGMSGHGAFQLEVHERYRQLRARERQVRAGQGADPAEARHHLPSL